MKRDVFGQASDYAPPARPLHPLVEKLRKRRYALNISQRVLAQKTGFSVTTIKQWEAGVSEPRAFAIFDWAQALGMALKLEKVE